MSLRSDDSSARPYCKIVSRLSLVRLTSASRRFHIVSTPHKHPPRYFDMWSPWYSTSHLPTSRTKSISISKVPQINTDCGESAISCTTHTRLSYEVNESNCCHRINRPYRNQGRSNKSCSASSSICVFGGAFERIAIPRGQGMVQFSRDASLNPDPTHWAKITERVFSEGFEWKSIQLEQIEECIRGGLAERSPELT